MSRPPFKICALIAVLPLSLLAADADADADDATPAAKPVPLLNRWFSSSDTAERAAEKAAPNAKPAAASAAKTSAAETADQANPRAHAQPLDAFELPEVDVISTTPLSTSGLALKKISGNVQTAEDEDIKRHEATNLTDFMNRRLESVNINDTQNNPYQPDVSYRGFTASPVLGTPVGISVYQDGVRVNEAFGDTVNWDLIPQVAIANMEVVPGSNPLYGLNTLGGALSLRTKSGFSHPGFSAQAYGGSYGRQNYQAEYGGYKGNFDWYFAGNVFDDSGWRPYSPTSVNQGFGKVGWDDGKTDLDLSFTYAGNNMQGVGATPQEMLQQNWSSIFTAPDITKNTMYFVNLKGSHRFTERLQLSGNVYNRNNNNYSLNSNTSGCTYASLTSCSDGVTQPGYFQASRAQQNGTGINLQLTSDYKILEHDNQLTVGGGYNYGKTQFTSGAQSAVFAPGNYEVATEAVGDPNYGPTVNITGQNRYSNVFATDTFSVYDWMHANASVSWTQAQVYTVDNYNQNAVDPNTGINSWLGNNVHFQRVNPSAGLTVNPLDALALKTPLEELTAYFNYNEGFRAPTTIEMACADPNAPCSLPNGFVSDPSLKPVVSHTLETGLRGKFSDALKWNVALYQTTNSNDILYLNAPGGSYQQGYFSNVGTTRRQGLEMGLNGKALEKLNWYVSYGYIDATYQSAMTLNNAYGAETVTPGNKIPGIPQNTLKVGGEYEVLQGVFLGSDMQYVSSQYARGDDQNIYAQIPDYTVLNINARYAVTKNIELFAMGKNVLDHHYVSFGQMGNNFFTGNNTQFQGPGAPATGYAGVRVHWN
jgi:iron complex outermembrane recepter protein